MTAFPIGRPRFVSLDECLAWHETALAEYGGMSGVREMPLLESALSMPRQGFGGSYAHAFPFEMAAAYAFHIAKNHPFADGNKRAALMCCGSFLRMNGWDLASASTEAADAIVAMVEGRLDKSELAAWLEAHSKPRPALELRDFFQLVRGKDLLQAMQASVVMPMGAEFVASLDEAAMALPLLSDLREQAASAALAGDHAGLARLGSQMSLLMHLYRLAEDMGYEW